MRSQVLGIMFSVGVGCSGVLAPTIFGLLIDNSDISIGIGYYICKNKKMKSINFYNLIF